MNKLNQNKEFHDYLDGLLGADKEAFLQASAGPRAIRINTLRMNADDFKKRLIKLRVEYRDLPFTPLGLEIVNDHIPLSHTIDFFLGYFHYQGVASQIPALVLDVQPGQRVLDIAAAPGSKSTQLAALMKNQGVLILNDRSQQRLQALNVNVQRAGMINQVILNLAGERISKIYPSWFDKVLVDAPCSALGTLAGSPEVASWWSIEKLKKLCISQKQLLISAYKALKIGGELVYSTCSITPEENEQLIDWMLDHYPLRVMDIPKRADFPGSGGITSYQGQRFRPKLQKALRLYPHQHGTEGFFVIKLKKMDETVRERRLSQAHFVPTLPWDDPELLPQLQNISEMWGIALTEWQNYRYRLSKDKIWLLHTGIEEIPLERLHNAGLLLAEKRLSGWKLTNQSAQYFNRSICKRRITLDEALLVMLFERGVIANPGVPAGYHVLEWDNTVVAIVYCDADILKLRLPHSFHLHL